MTRRSTRTPGFAGTGPSIIGPLHALGAWRSAVALLLLVLSAYWAVLAVVFGILPVGPHLTNRLGRTAAGDFIYFYPVATLAAEGRIIETYDWPLVTATARKLLGPDIPELDWAYPPSALLPLAPLGRLSPPAALAAWVMSAVALTVGLGGVALGTWKGAPLALLFPGAPFAIYCGHPGALMALLLTTVSLDGSRRWWRAGLALGLLSLKPQLVVGATLVLLAVRQYRVVASGVACGAALVLFSLLQHGLTPWVLFASSLGATGHLVTQPGGLMSRFASIFAAASTNLNGADHGAAAALHLAGACAGMALGARLLSGSTLPSLRTLGLAGATLLVTPYTLDYDLILLLPTWLMIVGECCDRPELSRTLLPVWAGLTVLVPLGFVTQLYSGRSVTAPLLLGILVLGLTASREAGKPVRRAIP